MKILGKSSIKVLEDNYVLVTNNQMAPLKTSDAIFIYFNNTYQIGIFQK